jgi:hypothetical protein
MSDVKPILCGKCHVSPERGFERDGEMWASCPLYGQEDRITDIQREAALQYATKQIGGMLDSLKTSGSLTVKKAPERNYRWITGE